MAATGSPGAGAGSPREAQTTCAKLKCNSPAQEGVHLPLPSPAAGHTPTSLHWVSHGPLDGRAWSARRGLWTRSVAYRNVSHLRQGSLAGAKRAWPSSPALGRFSWGAGEAVISWVALGRLGQELLTSQAAELPRWRREGFAKHPERDGHRQRRARQGRCGPRHSLRERA